MQDSDKRNHRSFIPGGDRNHQQQQQHLTNNRYGQRYQQPQQQQRQQRKENNYFHPQDNQVFPRPPRFNDTKPQRTLQFTNSRRHRAEETMHTVRCHQQRRVNNAGPRMYRDEPRKIDLPREHSPPPPPRPPLSRRFGNCVFCINICNKDEPAVYVVYIYIYMQQCGMPTLTVLIIYKNKVCFW